MHLSDTKNLCCGCNRRDLFLFVVTRPDSSVNACMQKYFCFYRIGALSLKSSVFSVGCNEFSDSSARAVVTGIKMTTKRC